LGFDDGIKSILLSKIPEARAFASQALPLPDIVSRIIGDGSNEQFLGDRKLEGIVTPAGVEKWKAGEAVPSIKMGDYLAFDASEAGVKLDVYRKSLSNARVSVTEVADFLDDQAFRKIRYARLKNLAEMEGPTALPKMLRCVRLTQNQSLEEFASKLGMDFRNLDRLGGSVLPSAKTLQRIRQAVRLTPEEDFLLRHTTVDLYLSRGSQRGRPGRYVLQLPLLLGHNPEIIVVQDISSGTRREEQTLEQRDNAKLLELIEDRILTRFKTSHTILQRLLVSQRRRSQPEIWRALGHPDSAIPVRKGSEPSGFSDEPRDAEADARQRAYASSFLLRALIHEELIQGELENESTSSLRAINAEYATDNDRLTGNQAHPNSKLSRQSNAGRRPLAETARSARARPTSASTAPASNDGKPRDALLQSNQLRQSASPSSVSKPTSDWKSLEKQLDICAEVIGNIQTDLRSPGQSSPRMLEGNDSQTVSYRDLLQWIAVKLNQTKDEFQAVQAQVSEWSEENWAAHVQTQKRLNQVDESLMALIPKVLALRHTAPGCSQRTLGAFMWAEMEFQRLKQKEGKRTARNSVRRRL
jgi:hypothetical protein